MNPDTIRALPFFKDISDDILADILPLLKEESFVEDECIFDEGSSSDRFFIIISGEVEIRKRIEQDDDRYKLIAVLGSGEFFGEMAVFLEQPRTASAFAMSPLSLVSLGRGDLLKMFSESPEAAFKVMGLLTSVLMNRLATTTRELVTIYETGRVVTGARSVTELTDGVLDGLMPAFERADSAIMALWNGFNEEYEIIGQRGFADMPLPASVGPEDPLMVLLAEGSEPVISFDIGSDERFSGAEFYGRGSIVAAPFFLFDGAMQGYVAFLNRNEKDAFSYSHMVLLSAAGGYVSVAVENLRVIQAEIDRIRLTQGKSSIRPY